MLSNDRAILLANLTTTLLLTGLIWTIQLVHYPLFEAVGSEGFARYHELHTTRITYLVGPLMLAEVIAAAALVFARPATVSASAAWLAAGLVAVAWLSTALVQVPLHGQLSNGLSVSLVRRLVATNWLRTAAWTGRAVLLVWWSATG